MALSFVETVQQVADSLGICATLLYSICSVESSGRNVINYYDGKTHSYGMCQIKLETARMFNPNLTQADLMIPHKNIYYAAMYLKRQKKRYEKEWDCVVASYNAGSCFRKRNGQVVNNEYVKKVSKEYRKNSHRRAAIRPNIRYCPKAIGRENILTRQKLQK